jgi:hypothetical protein
LLASGLQVYDARAGGRWWRDVAAPLNKLPCYQRIPDVEAAEFN